MARISRSGEVASPCSGDCCLASVSGGTGARVNGRRSLRVPGSQSRKSELRSESQIAHERLVSGDALQQPTSGLGQLGLALEAVNARDAASAVPAPVAAPGPAEEPPVAALVLDLAASELRGGPTPF
jgi:hypothetical protein